jgi:hypothetical protein
MPRTKKPAQKELHTLSRVEPHEKKLTDVERVQVLQFLNELVKVVKAAPVSDRTHYQGLNEFINPIFDLVHKQLYDWGFTNGDPIANLRLPIVQVALWVYDEVGECQNRIDWKIDVAHHHASTQDRQKAILKSIDAFDKMFHYGVSA